MSWKDGAGLAEGREEGRGERGGVLCYFVFAYAAEYVLAPVTAFPVGPDCGLLVNVSGWGAGVSGCAW